jgi:mediator of RNA polymerase II transcription subunit 10
MKFDLFFLRASFLHRSSLESTSLFFATVTPAGGAADRERPAFLGVQGAPFPREGGAMSATPVGKALEKVIWEVHQCEQILSTGGSSEDRILEKLEDLVRTLPSLRAAAAESEKADDANASATLLPVSALQLVDEGRCPTRGMVDGLLAVGEANAATKGKTNVFAKLRAELEAIRAARPRIGAREEEKETPGKRKRT